MLWWEQSREVYTKAIRTRVPNRALRFSEPSSYGNKVHMRYEDIYQGKGSKQVTVTRTRGGTRG